MFVVGLAALLLVAAVAAGIRSLVSNVNTLVADGIVERGSMATGTPVSAEAVFVDPEAGTAGIGRLAVANPEGFSPRPAIVLENLRVELDPDAAASDPLMLTRVVVENVRLLVEQSGGESNLRMLMASVESRADNEPPDEGSKTLLIDRLEVLGGTATLFLPELDEERPVTMPEVVMTGIGRESGGAAAASLARQVLEPLIATALESMAAAAEGDGPAEEGFRGSE